MYEKCIKRLLSIVISLCALVTLFPSMVIISIIIRLDSKGTVLFRQERLGKNQNLFIVYKFRTMIENAYQIGGATSYDGDPRITKVGAFLRKTSLDELPQLVNILKGDMCIIGPRPILREEFEPFRSNAFYAKRFCARPGMFCTVDVDYRATASRELQFIMDAEYVDKMSLRLDIEVFLKTFLTVIKQKNVYKEIDALVKDDDKQTIEMQ